jgi:hypothetical protein
MSTSDRIIHLNIYDLAKRWGLAPKTLDRWRQRGVGPLFLKIGGHVVYRLIDIEAYELANLKSTTNKHRGSLLTDEEKKFVEIGY